MTGCRARTVTCPGRWHSLSVTEGGPGTQAHSDSESQEPGRAAGLVRHRDRDRAVPGRASH